MTAQTSPPTNVGSTAGLGRAADALTNPPLGTVESARDIVQTIALAMKKGYTPNEILDENSPIGERVWAEATAMRRSDKWQDSRGMFVARLENMQKQGDQWLTVSAVLALLNDCDMLASRPNVGIEPPYSVGSNDGLGPF